MPPGKKDEWLLTFTRPGASGREIGRYPSRDECMLAAQKHFDAETGVQTSDDQDELGWQMSFASATALSEIGAYRVVRADLGRR